MLKVGVIGIGSMGKNHIRVYSELEDVELVGVEDAVNSLRNDPSEKELALPRGGGTGEIRGS